MASERDPAIREISGGVTLRIYVAPRASADKLVGWHNGALKVAIAAPPVDGAANKALIEFFANRLRVPKSSVGIISGESSRSKVLRVLGITAQTVEERLTIAL